MSDKTYFEGLLKFSETTGSFYIGNEDTNTVEELGFGDEFEVCIDGNWIKTGLEISSDDTGLIFKLKNTNYSGLLDDIPARK